MFAVGLGPTFDIFFAISSLLIAIPTGLKVFNWTATLWGGSIQLTTSMCFAIAFLIQFVIGGLTGNTGPADGTIGADSGVPGAACAGGAPVGGGSTPALRGS